MNGSTLSPDSAKNIQRRPSTIGSPVTVRLTMERTTQTERRIPQWRQFVYCLMGNDNFRRQRQREAGENEYINFKIYI